MSGAREKDQADFDLERFVDMFDEAITSSDPRVVNALRSLMMIVTLTRPETASHAVDREQGPLRRLYEDFNHLNRRLRCVEDEVRQLRNHYPNDAKYHDERYAIQAAASGLAQHVDQDVLNQLKKQAITKYTGDAIKGLYKK